MIAALSQFRSEFAKDPSKLFGWLGAGLRNVQTSLSIDELTRLAFLTGRVRPKNVTNLIAYGTIGAVGTQSVVYLSQVNQPLFKDLADDGFILEKAIPETNQPSP
jgi:hypothetical protein